MAATYCTAATLKASLGVGTLYDSYTWIEDTCQAAEDLINSFLTFNTAPVIATELLSNVATIVIAGDIRFVVGQSIVIANAGSVFNGTRTITAQSIGSDGNQYIKCAITSTDQIMHAVVPNGTALGPEHKTVTYANTPAIQAAALMLAENIWGSRFATQNGGVAVDGYSPSPFKMSNTLMASIRGLLAPYLSTQTMVG